MCILFINMRYGGPGSDNEKPFYKIKNQRIWRYLTEFGDPVFAVKTCCLSRIINYPMSSGPYLASFQDFLGIFTTATLQQRA